MVTNVKKTSSLLIGKMPYKITLVLFWLASFSAALAQEKIPPADMQLEPYRMTGHVSPLRKNLTFAEYKTQTLRRSLGSFFPYSPPSWGNLVKVADVPLYKKDRRRAKDVFRFKLEKNDTLVATTECHAILWKNETFSLLRKQDSSFFGARNTDLLDARISLAHDTSEVWIMEASNLNGSRNEDQKGVIRKGDQEIHFKRTTLLLRDQEDDNKIYSRFLTNLNLVYAFTYNDEVVAAVSYKKAGRSFWIREDLHPSLKDVIASAASVLTIRKNLYK